MSLVEPLIPEEAAAEYQKLEKYSNDPIANLENNIKKLKVEYGSFEFDGVSNIEFRDSDSLIEKEFYGSFWKSWDIKCAVTFAHKLVIGRIDGIIKIYDLDTKEEIVLKGHSNAVNCLKVTINEDFLVSGSRDETIIIWNLETYEQERVFKSDSEVFCLEVTSEYSLFSGSLSEKFVRKWNFYDENEISILSGHEDGITCMKSTNNNLFLITGSLDQSLRIWSIQDNQELHVFNNHNGAIDQIVISKDDKYIVSGSNQGNIVIWDLDKREKLEEDDSLNSKIIFLDISDENECIWVRHGENETNIYCIESKEYWSILNNYNVTALNWSKMNYVMYMGQNTHVGLFDVETMDNLAIIGGFESSIYKMLVVGEQSEYLASIMENGKIKIHEIYKKDEQDDIVIDYEVKSMNIKLTRDEKYLIIFNTISLKIWDLIEKKESFTYENIILINLQISYDDKYFIFNDKKASIIYVYSFQDMKEVTKFELECPNMPFCFSISKDNCFIVVGRSDGTMRALDIENKSKAINLEGCGSEILFLQINKTNEYVISADKDKNLNFWSLSEKKLLKSTNFAFSFDFLKLNDKHNCVIVGVQSFIEIWDIQKQTKTFKIMENQYLVLYTKISEDEDYLIFSQYIEARIFSFELMKEVDTVVSNNNIDELDITNDNKYMIIRYDEENAKLWHCEEKRFIAKIQFDDLPNNSFKFSADGKSIIAYNDKKIQIHNIEKYIDCSSIDSDPYFFPGEYDRIIKQRFINFLFEPSQKRWNKEFIDVIVCPIGWNILHYLCINDSVDFLSAALKDGGEIFRDKQNMSPLSYALLRNSRRCIDEILNYAINLEDENKQLHCIYQLSDDIKLLFSVQSMYLVPFLEVLFRRRALKDHVGFYEVTEELPMSIFSPVPKVYPSAFTGGNEIKKNEPSKQNEKLIQFWGSPWGYNYTAGSEESLFLLKKIDECESQDIFKTLFVQSVIREKWDYLWPAIITISVVYWLNLFTMIWYIFDPRIYILSSFAMLNGILVLYEFLQFSINPKDYVSEIWNLVDCARMALSITWVIIKFYDENIEGLSFAVVLFNFFRGLTYFRAFDFTRFYVRLILMALSDSLAFLIIFLYSTLAFGVLYASLNENLSFNSMWTLAYELNMGNFDNDGFSFLQYSCFTLATLINVVMMLNLLVSTLGDTFDKFQMMIDELDCKEMLQLVLEFESLMFWARSQQAKLINKGKLMYLQRCDIFQDSDVPDKWQGKIKELSLKIDGVKDDILGNKKNSSEELKSIEESIKEKFESIIDEKVIKAQEKTEKSLNEKIESLESKVELKINGIMEMLEMIKAKLED